jgi:adhesin HecA-like repeat protein
LENLEKGILRSDNSSIIKTPIFKNLHLLEAGRDLKIHNCALIENSGRIVGQKNMDPKDYNEAILDKAHVLTDIQATQINNHSGTIKGFVLKIKGQQLDNLNGTIWGFGLLDVDASIKVQNKENGDIKSEHFFEVKTDLLENKGQVKAIDITFNGQSIENYQQIHATKKLTLNARDHIHNFGGIVSQLPRGYASRALSSVENEEIALLTLSSGNLLNKGTVTGRKIKIEAQTIDNDKGSVSAQYDLNCIGHQSIINQNKAEFSSDDVLGLQGGSFTNSSKINASDITLTFGDITNEKASSIHARGMLTTHITGFMTNNGQLYGDNAADLHLGASTFHNHALLTTPSLTITGGVVNNNKDARLEGMRNIELASVLTFENTGIVSTSGMLSGSVANLHNTHTISAQDIDLKKTNITQKGHITALQKMDLSGDNLDNEGVMKAANLIIDYEDIISRAGEFNGSAELGLTAKKSFTDNKKEKKSTILTSMETITLNMPKTNIDFWGSIMGRVISWNGGKKLSLSNFIAGDTNLTFHGLDEIEAQESSILRSKDLKISDAIASILGQMTGDKASLNGPKVSFGDKSLMTLTESLTLVSDHIDIKGKHKSLGKVTLTGADIHLADELPVQSINIEDANLVDLALGTKLISVKDVIIHGETITQNGFISAETTNLTGVTQNILGHIASRDLTLRGKTANIHGHIESAITHYDHQNVNVLVGALLEKGNHLFTEKVNNLNLSGAITCKNLEIPESVIVTFNKGSSITLPNDFKHSRAYPLVIGTNITSGGNIHIKTPGLLQKTSIFTAGGNIDYIGSSVEDSGETYAPNHIVTYDSKNFFPLLPANGLLLAGEVKIISGGAVDIRAPIKTANLTLKVPGNINVSAALTHDVLSLHSEKGAITIDQALQSNKGLTLVAAEKILINAPLTTKGDIVCQSNQDIEANNLLKSEGNITLKAPTGAISLHDVDALKDVILDAQGLITIHAPVISGGGIDMRSVTKTILLNGSLTAPGIVTLKTNETLNTNQDVFGGHIHLTSDLGDLTNTKALYSAGDLSLQAGKITNLAGYIVAIENLTITSHEDCRNQSGLIYALGKAVLNIGGEFKNMSEEEVTLQEHSHPYISALFNALDPSYKTHLKLYGGTHLECIGHFNNESADISIKGESLLDCKKAIINRNSHLSLDGDIELHCEGAFDNKNTKLLHSGTHLTGFVRGDFINDADSFVHFEDSVDLGQIQDLQNHGALRFGTKIGDNVPEKFVLSAQNITNHGKIRAFNGLILNVPEGIIRNLREIYIIGDFLAKTPLLDNSAEGISLPRIDVQGNLDLTMDSGIKGNVKNVGHTVVSGSRNLWAYEYSSHHDFVVGPGLLAQHAVNIENGKPGNNDHYTYSGKDINAATIGTFELPAEVPTISCSGFIISNHLDYSYGRIKAQEGNVKNSYASPAVLKANYMSIIGYLYKNGSIWAPYDACTTYPQYEHIINANNIFQPRKISSGSLDAYSLTLADADDFILTRRCNVAHLDLKGKSFSKKSDPMGAFDVSGQTPAAILSLLQSVHLMSNFERGAFDSPHAFISDHGKAALIPIGLRDWANICDVTEEQRENYFMALIPKDEVTLSADGAFDPKKAITGRALRLYNLAGQNVTFLFEQQKQNENLQLEAESIDQDQQIVEADPRQNLLLDLIAKSSQNQNILPTQLIGENGEVFFGFVLGLNEELGKRFKIFKNLGLLCDVDGHIVQPKARKMLNDSDEDVLYQDADHSYWGFASGSDGEDDFYDDWREDVGPDAVENTTEESKELVVAGKAGSQKPIVALHSIFGKDRIFAGYNNQIAGFSDASDSQNPSIVFAEARPGRTIFIRDLSGFLSESPRKILKAFSVLPSDIFNLPQAIAKPPLALEADPAWVVKARLVQNMKIDRKLVAHEDYFAQFTELPDLSSLFAKAFEVPELNEHIQQFAAKISEKKAQITTWEGLSYTGRLEADILGILQIFGFPKEFDQKTLLGDASVIARVLEDAALRTIGKPYFHEIDRVNNAQRQVKELLINLVIFCRQHYADIPFGKPFPEALRPKVTKPILWFVEEDYTIDKVTLKLLMPYIIFPDSILEEIEAQLKGPQTLETLKVDVSGNAEVANLRVTEKTEITCENFLSSMGRDVRYETYYNTSIKKGKEQIESSFVAPIVSFRDYEELNFGKSLTIHARRNIVNDGGKLKAKSMYFEAGGNMHNTGQISFVDHFMANINGHFTNDIIVVVEYKKVQGVRRHRTYSGYAARNQIKQNSGNIVAIGDGRGLFNVKTGGDFKHRGDIDVKDVNLKVGGNFEMRNLPDQFIATWDPGGQSKKGQDCFSIASQYTPSHLRARDGSIVIVAGKQAKAYASLFSAADDIIMNAEKFEFSAEGEAYLANVDISNGRRKRVTTAIPGIIIQKVRAQAGQDIRLIAREDVTITGGDILAGLEVAIKGKNINLRPLQLMAEARRHEYGSHGLCYYINKTAHSISEVATTDVLGKNVAFDAENDINIKASILMAMESIKITAGRDINVVEELVHHYVHSSQFEGHLKFFGQETMQRVLDRDFRAAGRAFADEFSTLCHLKSLIKARHGADYAVEGVKTIVDLYQQYKQIEKLGFINYCKKEAVEKLLSSSASISQTKSKKEWIEAILPVMKAKEIVMKAGRNILMRGVQIEAENMDVEAQNVTIEAAQEFYDAIQRRKDLGIHAHVNFDPEKNEFLAPSIGVSAGYQKSQQSKVMNKNAHINVKKFKLNTPGTFKLEGANINAEEVEIVAHALIMRSLVDTETGHHRSISGGLDLNLGTYALSGSLHGCNGRSYKANVNEATGIKAIKKFMGEIGNTTHLQGAFIEAANGVLNSPNFTHSEIAEADQSRQISYGVANLGFANNSAFVMPEGGRQSRNQKGVLRSSVSSGVQIITQSNLNNLIRDLEHARKITKKHKHYNRVVIPIPGHFVDSGFKSIGKSLTSAAKHLCGRENEDIPEFVKKEIAEDEKAYEALQKREDLSDDEKDRLFRTYKAHKDAERYGIGYLTGSDKDGFAMHGEVHYENGNFEVRFAVYEKEVFAQKLAQSILANLPEGNEGDLPKKLEENLNQWLDVYNSKEKLAAFADNLKSHCAEFNDYLGLQVMNAPIDPDASPIMRKMFMPALGGAMGGIPGAAAGGAALGDAKAPDLSGLLFAGEALVKFYLGYQEADLHGMLQEKINADKMSAPDVKPWQESFPGDVMDPMQLPGQPINDNQKPQILATPGTNISKPQVEIFPEAEKLPPLGGFDIWDGKGLQIFEQNLHDPYDVRERGKVLPKEVYNKGDNAWKEVLIGRAQKTKTPNHRRTIYEDSIAKAQSGDFEKIWHNRSWNVVLRELGHQDIPSGKLRPDSIALGKDGKLYPLEVRSKSDEPKILKRQNETSD